MVVVVCGDAVFSSFAWLQWPVQPEDLPNSYYQLPSPEVIGTRVFEEAVFMDKVFPPAHDVEFIDLNSGISWHLGWKNGSSAMDVDRIF
jgi:hypothetical protein